VIQNLCCCLVDTVIQVREKMTNGLDPLIVPIDLLQDRSTNSDGRQPHLVLKVKGDRCADLVAHVLHEEQNDLSRASTNTKEDPEKLHG
jgi:hypothetical protein